MKCDIPAEVGANILRVARAEHRERLDEADAGDDGDQGLEGHEEAGGADHVIVEAGEAACAAQDRSDNTDTHSLPPITAGQCTMGNKAD